MPRKPLDMGDVEAIAARVAAVFRDRVDLLACRMKRRPMHGDERDRISAEVERTIVRMMGEYVREFEPIRDRESLALASGDE